MGASKEKIQRVTVVAANACGGPPQLRGHFVMAEQPQVANPSWWDSFERMEGRINVIVNCIGSYGDKRQFYPNHIAARSQILTFDPRSRDNKSEQFNRVWPIVLDELRKGRKVLVHCRQSFHRGPIAVACLMMKFSGADYKVGCVM